MIDFKNINGFYFVGIGGIGMSALAFYFKKDGFSVAGYDRTETDLTKSLVREGCPVIYDDNDKLIPDLFFNIENRNRVLIVYTPAIPVENRILAYFRNNGYIIFKRSEILGEISNNTDTLAVAGTHGKTSVSTMIAHLLKQSHLDCSAFLGGISKNYNTNLLTGKGKYTVMEADEFDRSFHRLSPQMAVITAVDADHLDIYGDLKTMIGAYNEFCTKIRAGGVLVVNSKIRKNIIVPSGVVCYTYGTEPGANFQAQNIVRNDGYYSFDIRTPSIVIKDLHFAFPGTINIENFTAAISIAWMCGVTENEIRNAVASFTGVKRRFDIRVNTPQHAYVDDYGHHPEEIRACINTVREFFGGRKITGIFQPHLYSRTRDHVDGFAAVLDTLDEAILLPIYPAREKPIEGVSSEMILSKMKLEKKRLLNKSDIPGKLNKSEIDVMITIGAGDIDTLIEPLEAFLKNA
jgi:UDP-N-acetylmuramate--alanine ligase